MRLGRAHLVLAPPKIFPAEAGAADARDRRLRMPTPRLAKGGRVFVLCDSVREVERRRRSAPRGPVTPSSAPSRQSLWRRAPWRWPGSRRLLLTRSRRLRPRRGHEIRTRRRQRPCRSLFFAPRTRPVHSRRRRSYRHCRRRARRGLTEVRQKPKPVRRGAAPGCEASRSASSEKVATSSRTPPASRIVARPNYLSPEA